MTSRNNNNTENPIEGTFLLLSLQEPPPLRLPQKLVKEKPKCSLKL